MKNEIIYVVDLTFLLVNFQDDNGKLLSSPYHVGIVTSPAPNASIFQDQRVIRDTMTERIKRVLSVFKANKHDCLVLGAFGCGVFRNDPLDVALSFQQHLESEEFKNSFRRIIFAILDPQMCEVFQQVFTGTDRNPIQQQIADISLNEDENQQYKEITKRAKKGNNNYKQARDRKNRNYDNNEYE